MGFGGDSGGDFRLWYKQKCALLDDLQQLFGADFEGAFQALTRYDEA
jgi:hypothetical protein